MSKRKKDKELQVLDFLNFGIFPGHCLLICGFSFDEFIEILKKKKPRTWYNGIKDRKAKYDKSHAMATEVVLYKKDVEHTLYYVFIKNSFQRTDEEYVTLSHEILHICQYLLPHFLKRDEEFEAEAYLHSHLMSQALNLLK